MSPKILLVAFVAVIVCSGCGKSLEDRGATACAGDECTVTVQVVGGTPKAVDDPLNVRAGNHGAGGNGVLIRWQIQDNDYSFHDDGIQPKDESAGDWPSQFDQPGTGGSGKQFHWRDKNSDSKAYKYKITIYDKAGNPHSSDPTIKNGAS